MISGRFVLTFSTLAVIFSQRRGFTCRSFQGSRPRKDRF